MRQVRAIQRAIQNGNYRGAGTRFHSLNFRYVRDAQTRGFFQRLNIDRRIDIPEGGFRAGRRPDYLFDSGDIYDIKTIRSGLASGKITEQQAQAIRDRFARHGSDKGYHYLGSPKIFCDMGHAFGQGMNELLEDG